MEDELLNGASFAKEKGKTASWGTRLAQEANKAGLSYPKKYGNYWMATREQWENILIELDWELRDRKPYKR
ncbi:hypothetical protein [Halobacillus massiliensis]|uniref:hypothetical protein n=1 Tax=Halobacillus massiliensis TaxID=1926286 RepID=UPI0009E21307|nr:hypothetical protein [Halobacillus massiliensis]